MKNWRYGIVKDKDGYHVGEIYLDDKGNVEGYATKVSPYGGSSEEILDNLQMMLQDALKYPVYEVKGDKS